MEFTYKQANIALYKKNFVGYSLFPRKLKEVEKILKKHGYETKFLLRKAWARLDFVRDGSMIVLEDTLLVRKGKEFCGFVTPTKLIVYKHLNELKNLYSSPLTLKELAYLACLAFLCLTYLALRGA